MNTFNDFSLDPSLLAVLNNLGYTKPTEIQAKTIPLLLAKKETDFHGQAQTGTGKTFAFGLPLLQHINKQNRQIQALIIAPTRELVVQICQSLEPFAQAMQISMTPIYGGVSIDNQMSMLRRGMHIVVGTPGRLIDHINRKTLALNNVNIVVLDEADIMLDMGFKQEVDEILNHTSHNRNLWLFSATVKQGINDLMKTHMKNTVTVSVSKNQVGNNSTKQYFCIMPMRERLDALCRFLDNNPSMYGFIFCPTKITTSELSEKLTARGYKVNALHGDMNQSNRNRVIKAFKNREFNLLVATDVAARGLDVPDVTHVINYTLPDDQENYIHRIGRTGRAGKEGIAITFINQRELYFMKRIAAKYNGAIEPIQVPSFEDIATKRSEEALEYLKSIVTNQSQESHIQALRSSITGYSQEELTQAVLAFLHDKFFKHLKKNTYQPTTSSSRESYSNNTELLINVGSDDGIGKEEIMNLLLKKAKIEQNSIISIKVIKRRTFVVVPAMVADGIMTALSNDVLGGRRIRVSIAESEPSTSSYTPSYRPRERERSDFRPQRRNSSRKNY